MSGMHPSLKGSLLVFQAGELVRITCIVHSHAHACFQTDEHDSSLHKSGAKMKTVDVHEDEVELEGQAKYEDADEDRW